MIDTFGVAPIAPHRTGLGRPQRVVLKREGMLPGSILGFLVRLDSAVPPDYASFM